MRAGAPYSAAPARNRPFVFNATGNQISNVIELKSLTKQFGAFTAVDQISLQVQQGEVLGFLGPNGAGKSTTMKMLTGFLAPSAGSASICGHDVVNDTLAAQRHIGYLPEGAPLYGDMTVGQFLRFIGEIRGFSGSALNQRVLQAVDRLELRDVFHQSIETLSKGFKRRVGLAQAILHDPKVLILDEPTDGLDPNQKHQVRHLIETLAQDKIVVISTHILEEVTAVCTRAVIISAGRVVADGTPLELEQRSRYHQAVSMVMDVQVDLSGLQSLQGVAGVEADQEAGLVTVFPVNGTPIFPQVQAHVQEKGWRVQAMHVERGRLDEVFREITVGGAQ